MNHGRSARGFTLLEIMVALAIFALAAVALVKSVSTSIDTVTEIELRQFADMVAHNRMVAVQLAGQTTSSDGVETLAGREFLWRVLATPTPDEGIRRLDIEVSLRGEERVLRVLTGFIGVRGS